jgi:SPP1 gp7 family putative phage head morphogenesis protein
MDTQERIDKYIFARSVNWRLRLDRWEDQQLEQVLKTVDQARGEIISELDARGKARKLTDWNEARLTSLLGEMEDMTVGIKQQLGQDLDDIATTAAQSTIKEYNDIFSVDGTMPGFNNVEPSPEQLRAMVQTPLGGLQAAEVVKNAFDHNLIDRVKQDIDAGLLRGESYQKLVQRVEQNWGGARNDVISLVRTQTQEMNNRGAWAVADQNRDVLQQEWEWSAILDNRACIRCASLDGRRFNIDDPIPIPRHLSCRCCRRYLTKSYRDLGVNIDEMEPALRNWVLRDGQVATGGAVAETLGKFKGNYRDFFGGLPYKRQVEIVGKTRADLIRKGKLNFDDLADGRGRVYKLNKGWDGLSNEKQEDVI